MADIDEAEQLIIDMDGIENAWEGRLFRRVVRTIRVLITRGKATEDRVTDLQARVAALETAQKPLP